MSNTQACATRGDAAFLLIQWMRVPLLDYTGYSLKLVESERPFDSVVYSKTTPAAGPKISHIKLAAEHDLMCSGNVIFRNIHAKAIHNMLCTVLIWCPG